MDQCAISSTSDLERPSAGETGLDEAPSSSIPVLATSPSPTPRSTPVDGEEQPGPFIYTKAKAETTNIWMQGEFVDPTSADTRCAATVDSDVYEDCLSSESSSQRSQAFEGKQSIEPLHHNA